MSEKPDNYMLGALLSILPYAASEVSYLHESARKDGGNEEKVLAEEAQEQLDIAYAALNRFHTENVITPDDEFWKEAVKHDDRLCAIPACAEAYGITTLQATNYVNHYEASIK